MINTQQKARAIHPGQSGFALPLVLVAIASLAIITLVGYRAVTGAAAIVATIQDNASAEQGLFTAEAEAAFTFLTSSAVSRGIATGGADISESQDEGNGRSTLSDDQIWQANGATRRSTLGQKTTLVSYFDAAGFAPIERLRTDDLAALLLAAGFDGNDAEQVAARIADFQDGDTNRRFRGAEHADYRLFGVSPPTNSPLRSVGELAAVLGYADLAPASSWDFILEHTRFGGVSSQFKPLLGPPAMAGLFDIDEDAQIAPDPISDYGSEDSQPTETARFLLAHRGEAGLTRKRAVEIMRTASAPDKPFRRIWIYDKVNDDNGSPTPANERRDLAPVYQPAPGADSR